MLANLLDTIIVYAVPMVLAITLHEVAHGWVAYQCGDPTAHRMGRLTLNPIAHVDPVGTLMVPGGLVLMSALTGGGMIPIFGWAKPVPVNTGYFRTHYRGKMIATALAGPASNLLQAIIWLFILKALWDLGYQDALAGDVAKAGISVNLMLMAFNLIPLPPLDGGVIVHHLLPWQLAQPYSKLYEYGQWIVIVLIMTGLTRYLVTPFLMFGQWLLTLLI